MRAFVTKERGQSGMSQKDYAALIRIIDREIDRVLPVGTQIDTLSRLRVKIVQAMRDVLDSALVLENATDKLTT